MLANLYKEHQQNQSETRRQAGASAPRLPHRRSAIAGSAIPGSAVGAADRGRGLLRAENRRQEVLRAIPAVTDRLVSEVNEHLQSIFVRPRPSLPPIPGAAHGRFSGMTIAGCLRRGTSS